MIESAGRRIGVFGVVTADWAKISSAQNDLAIQVENPIEYSKRAYAKLAGKVDLIFALSSLSDDEVKDLAEAIPDLKYILRSNASVRYARKNQVIGNTVAMTCPSRGKYLALLSFVEKDGSLNFEDISQRKAIESRIEMDEKRIERLLKRFEAKDVEALNAKLEADSPDRKKLDRYLQYLDQNKEKLTAFPADKSYFEVDRVSLDKRVGNDPEILKMVDEVKAKHGDPGKMKRSVTKRNKKLNLNPKK